MAARKPLEAQSSNPHPLAHPAQNLHGAIELLSCMSSRHDRAHTGFAFRDSREADARREQTLLEKPSRKLMRAPGLSNHDRGNRSFAHARIEAAVDQSLLEIPCVAPEI